MTAYRISGEQKVNNRRRGLVIAGAAAAALVGTLRRMPSLSFADASMLFALASSATET